MNDPGTDDKIDARFIPLTYIDADETFNCRGKLSAPDVHDLAKDIDVRGLVQPVAVAPYEDGEKPPYKYRLIAGFRRFKAHQILKKNTIAAVIREDMCNETEALFFNLSENLIRSDLNILQEARSLQKLKDHGITETDAAHRLSKSRGWVQVRYLILKLPPDVQEEIAAGLITQPQIRELYAIYSLPGGKSKVYDAVKKIKEAKIKGLKNFSVSPHKDRKGSKHTRNKKEMLAIMEHIRGTIGVGLHSVTLAWASGELTNLELYQEFKRFADEHNIVYKIPVIDDEDNENGESN
jgi:ParB/RepB/Spo0J family partition protein